MPSAPPASPPSSAGPARTPSSTPSASAPARTSWPFTTENTAGVDQVVFPTFPVVMGYGAGRGVMSNIGSFNPAMLVHGQQAVTLHRPIPPEGTATLTSRAHRHVRQGQGRRRRHRQRRDDGRRAALHARACRRSSAARAAGAAIAGRPDRRTSRPTVTPDHERDVPDVARPGVPVPAQRRPQPAAHRSVVRRRRRFRPSRSCTACAATASPAAACCTCCAAATRRRFHHIEGRFASPVLPGEALTDQGLGDRRR